MCACAPVCLFLSFKVMFKTMGQESISATNSLITNKLMFLLFVVFEFMKKLKWVKEGLNDDDCLPFFLFIHCIYY